MAILELSGSECGGPGGERHIEVRRTLVTRTGHASTIGYKYVLAGMHLGNWGEYTVLKLRTRRERAGDLDAPAFASLSP
jgi:hypothetical protein